MNFFLFLYLKIRTGCGQFQVSVNCKTLYYQRIIYNVRKLLYSVYNMSSTNIKKIFKKLGDNAQYWAQYWYKKRHLWCDFLSPGGKNFSFDILYRRSTLIFTWLFTWSLFFRRRIFKFTAEWVEFIIDKVNVVL